MATKLSSLFTSPTGGGGGVTDHASLTGLEQDDHGQYHTDERGDARYSVQNGFVDRTTSTLSFNGATRVLTITYTSPTTICSEGLIFTINGSTSEITIADTEGLHYVYIDSYGELHETTTFSLDLIRLYAFISAIYYNAADNVAILVADERHGREMDSATHAYLHNTVGSQWGGGLGLSSITAEGSGDLAAHAQLAVNSGSIWDEDIQHTIGGLTFPASIPILYRSGAGGLWRKIAGSGYVVTTTGSGRAAWNQDSAGTWSLAEVGASNFVLMHLIATGDISTPLMWVCGQAQYTTLALARTGADSEWLNLNLGGLGSLSPEFVVCATIILQTSSGYANAVKSRIRTLADGSTHVDWRELSPAGAGSVGGVTDHALLTGLSADDHPQYNVLVADEGVTKTTKAESMNFVGAGVSVTNTGDAVTITIEPPVKITVGTSAPGSPSIGDLWVDTN